MSDITMNVDDTLELDTIIENSSRAKEPITVTQGTDYNLSGFQTHTGVFDPQSSGDYTIKVNGQTISIKVNEANSIPESEDLYLRYDYNKATKLDSLTEQTGSGRDLTGGPISGFGSRNGLQTGVFDGSSGQDMEGSGFTTTVSKPWHLFLTAKCNNSSSSYNEYIISSPDDSWGFQNDRGNWEIYDGSNSIDGNSSDTNWHVFDILYDSSGEFSLNVDGSDGGVTDDGTGSAADTISGFEIGDWKAEGIDFDGQIGEVLMYSTDKTANASNIRSYLQRWI